MVARAAEMFTSAELVVVAQLAAIKLLAIKLSITVVKRSLKLRADFRITSLPNKSKSPTVARHTES